MRVLFPYLAQLHQVLHSLPIAAEMALRHAHIDVHAAGATAKHVAFIRHLLQQHAPGAPVHVERVSTLLFERWRYRRKRRLLLTNWHYFRSFDAIVTPERTSLLLRRLGLRKTRFVWTSHGAGDRAVGFADDIHQFDYVLVAGKKIEQRLLEAKQIRPGDYATGIYAKFDWLRAPRARPRLFDNDRPVVLYNPHFRSQLSSWPMPGAAILDFFASQRQWNLIFAPHVRLFDAPQSQRHRSFERYRGLPNVLLDLGSERSIDMTYLNAADIYLGDVSSQVAEFVCRPRPCLFMNAHRVSWRGDPNYLCWELGPVIDDVSDLGPALGRAMATHGEYLDVQRRYVEATFGASQGACSAARGADAIAAFLASNTAVSTRRTQSSLAKWWQRKPSSGMS